MATDTERREVAARLRGLRPGACFDDVYEALGAYGPSPYESRGLSATGLAMRLADLIKPTDGFDLDTVQRVCFECMEGCDEPEWTLYTTIYDAIARYKRGDSGPTCDRDALLALAGELKDSVKYLNDWQRPFLNAREVRSMAQRIRESIGE